MQRSGLYLFLLLLCAVYSTEGVKAQGMQDEKTYPTARRLFFGGNLGLQFGTYTDIEVSPIAGYWITPRIAPGVGLKYEYYKSPFVSGTHIFGGSIFTSVLVVKNLNQVIDLIHSDIGILAHAEYEALSLDNRHFNLSGYSTSGRFIQQNFYVGGGIRQPVGENGAFYLLVLWNLNQNMNSFYSSPLFRVGFTF